MDYLDLDLHIGPQSKRAFPVSADSPGIGGARGSMRRLNLVTELLALQVALLESDASQPARRGKPSRVEEPARELGRKLFSALFTGEVKAAYDAALVRASDRDGLRVRLCIDDPKLMTIPWEFLFDPAQEEYLCLRRDVALIRYLPVLQPPPSFRVALPLKVLALVANPSDEHLAKLDLQSEVDRVKAAFEPCVRAGLVTLEFARGQTVDDLEVAMRTEPNVFHFVGHGDFDTMQGEGGIFLTAENGQAVRLEAQRLARILSGRKQLRLVVLNACEGARGNTEGVFSSTAATLVRRGIPAVLAMQYKINDLAASRFAQQFYEHLAAGDPVDKAVTEARIAMDFGARTIEWGSPVLYMQSQDGVLFELSGPLDAGVRSPPLAVVDIAGPGAAPRVAAAVKERTWVVDPLNRGDIRSIGEAIAAADPGDVIQVRAGYYAESLVIDKPLPIVGDSSGDVTLQADGQSAITFRASNARVANLTIRQAATSGASYAVDIAGGRLVLEGCDISSSGKACVMIRGGAGPRLSANRIHNSRMGGVYIVDNSRGELVDNEICFNALAGVTIKHGSDPRLLRNRIHDNQQTGVLVLDGGLGHLEDNDIAANTFAGVSVKNEANPVVSHNTIRDGLASGVYVHDLGRGTFEDNTIIGNGKSGVTIEAGGNPTLRRNTISGSRQRGLYIHDSGQGTLEDNVISDNQWSGAEIRTGSRPTLRRNRIIDGKSVGVIVARSAGGLLEENHIANNANDGVEIRSDADPTLRANQIGPGNARGVYCHDGAKGTLVANEIFGNRTEGVEVRTGSTPALSQNRIHNNARTGVLIARNGAPVLDDNEMSGNALSGVEIRSDATPTLRRNRIDNNGTVGVWVHEAGASTLEDNELHGNKVSAWDIADGSRPKLKLARNAE